MSKIVPVIFLNFYRGTTYSSIVFLYLKAVIQKILSGARQSPPHLDSQRSSRRRIAGDSRFRARNESEERILVTSSIILRGMSQSIPVPAPLATRRTPSLSFHFAFHITGVRIPRRFSAPFSSLIAMHRSKLR